MNVEEQVKEILRGQLKIIAGASQIAIDRGASSGVIDFEESINKAQSQIHALYLSEFEKILPKEQKHPKGYEQEEDYLTQIRIGWNQCLENIRFKIEELRKEK